MKTYRLNYLIIFLLCYTSALAQTHKLDKTYKTNNNVTINLDARHTNVVVETWDRNEVQIEAYIEGANDRKQDVKKLLDNWKLETRATAGEVTIRSEGGGAWDGKMDMTALDEKLSKLPEMLGPLNEMVGPLLESISNNPLPPKFYESMGDLNFDYEAYRKEGDAYLKRWEKKVEKNFGKDFEKSMEQWASQFRKDTVLWKKNMEAWGENFGKDMEAWGEDFGKSMEAWGEKFGKDMEAWAEQLEKEVEAKYGDTKGKVIVTNSVDSKVKQNIRVKMPKNARLNLDVRHGEVKLSGRTNDLNANLSHSRFSANTLAGKGTNVKVAYTPVKVRNWEYGVLNASYVQDLVIDRAVSINLNSNSSEVTIKQIEETGIMKGTFGELMIEQVGRNFQALDITLENSDLQLSLPDVAYTFSYNGTKSKVKYPQNLSLKSSQSYDSQRLSGFNKNRNAEPAINISARFSEVLLK